MTLHSLIDQIAQKVSLEYSTVRNLLQAGWTLSEKKGEPKTWVSPEASRSVYIPHQEPVCKDKCLNQAPHNHGLPCHRLCPECHGVCHPDCPAHKEK